MNKRQIMQPTNNLFDQSAIVIGGSMAGLWAARVLANRFGSVQIVERDVLPEGAEHRPGVPQSHQVHVLLMRGAEIMGEFFPGIIDDLVEQGAVRFDLTGESRTKMSGHWIDPFDSGMMGLGVSRVLLESTLRRHLQRHDRVTFVDGARRWWGWQNQRAGASTACGYAAKPSATPSTRSTPILWWTPAGAAPTRRSGWASSATPRPKQKLSLPSSATPVAAIDPAPALGAIGRMMVVAAQPPYQPRSGILFPEENGTMMVMLGGANKDYPPTNEAGFLDFARSLDAEFGQTVADAEPITSIRGYRRTENRLNGYDKLTRWPQRFVVLGDAYCALNPIYGQGMTLAALSATTLDEHLAGVESGDCTLDEVAQPFQRALAKTAAPAWEMATGADEMWPLTEGGREGLLVRFSRWYNHQLGAAMPHDRVIHKTFIEVSQLTKPTQALLAPGILWRILRSRVRNRSEPASTEEPVAVAG